MCRHFYSFLMMLWLSLTNTITLSGFTYYYHYELLVEKEHDLN